MLRGGIYILYFIIYIVLRWEGKCDVDSSLTSVKYKASHKHSNLHLDIRTRADLPISGRTAAGTVSVA